MINNKNLTTSKGRDKISVRRKLQQQTDNDRQQDIEDEENKNKSDDSICQTMQLGILFRTKYKSNPGYKAVYNSAISDLITLLMTGPKISDNSENNLSNPWPQCNSIILNRIILNV